MRLGVGKADITPTAAVQLAGFGSRRGALVSSVTHPIHVRVAVLGEGPDTIAIVSADLLNWSTESDPRFRRAVEAATGVRGERVMFAATHTHSAPQVSHRHAPILGVVDEGYLDHLENRIVEAATAAAADRGEVLGRRASGRFDLARSRRADLDLSVSDDIPQVDDELSIVAFDGQDGPIALFVHYACHPVINADNTVTGDFFGVAMQELERRMGVIAFPLQGCCGDINPEEGLPFAGAAVAEEVGGRFADRAEKILDDAQAVHFVDPRVAWTSVELPLEGMVEPAELLVLGRRDDLDGEWARALSAHPELIRDHAICLLQSIDLGPDLGLLAMNGEVTTDYGIHAKERSGRRVLSVAYANGMIGYVPTARQIRAGGYEVDQSARCYLLPGTFSTSIEARLRAAIDTLVPPGRPRVWSRSEKPEI